MGKKLNVVIGDVMDKGVSGYAGYSDPNRAHEWWASVKLDGSQISYGVNIARFEDDGKVKVYHTRTYFNRKHHHMTRVVTEVPAYVREATVQLLAQVLA